MSCSVLPAAELEAAEAAIWYDDRRSGLGDEFLAELRQSFDDIQRAPEACFRAEFYRGRHDVRRYLLRRFPYVVIFVLRPEEVVIVAVSHVRRRPLYWLDRLRP